MLGYRSASAAIWSEITAASLYNNGSHIEFTYNIFAWDESDETPNPCYKDTGCRIWIGVTIDKAGSSNNVAAAYWSAANTSNRWISNAATMGELGAAFKTNAGLPQTGTIQRSAASYIVAKVKNCVGIFYKNDFASIGYYSGGELMPNSICGEAPTPYGRCSFVEDSINLDHGTVARSQLDGHEVSINVTMSCDYESTVGIYVLSGDNLPLRDDGSLYSEIYINNVLGTDGLSMSATAGEHSLTFKSKLRTNGTVAAGEFSASTVAVINLE